MIQRLQRQIIFLAPAAVMSAWATVMLHTLIAGHINRLLSPMFRSYVGIAGVVLLVLSALHLLLYRPNPERAPSSWRQMGRWLVLLVPVLAASVLSPAALSDTTARLRSSGPNGVAGMPSMSDASATNAKAALDTDPNLPAPMEVTDLITVSHTPALLQKFNGRQVHVIGLFEAGSSPKLMRWVMWCCAADAVPASVAMNGNLGGTWKDQQWLDVTGTARFPSTMGQVIPQIDVTSVKKTDEPDEPFLSP
jgi:putative membrane protein